MTEGYCSRMALNADDEIIGYEFVSLGKMMAFIEGGMDANEALKKATGHYGQWDAAAAGPRLPEEDAAPEFDALFLTVHGCASLIANNAMRHDPASVEKTLLSLAEALIGKETETCPIV